MKHIFAILIFVLGSSSSLFAPPLPPPPPNVAISLDVVVGLLILGGVVFGVRKLFKKAPIQEAENA